MRERVLDHGYVELVTAWGSDEGIIEAARMSTQQGFKGWGPVYTYTCPIHGTVPREHIARSENMVRGYPCWAHMNCGPGGISTEVSVAEKPGDEKLLKYLWDNKHSTPFEMAGATFEVQAPIFVFREWHRHRTQSFSEMSARYAPLPDVNYVPTLERLLVSADANKQAGTVKGAEKLTVEAAETFRGVLGDLYFQLESAYQSALKQGVPKELARIILPIGRYSRMRASANLRNWLGFLSLRLDTNAQQEIRDYAWAVHEFLSKRFPRTVSLFDEARHE